MEGQKYLVALSHFKRFGPRRLKYLFDYFASWQRVWEASPADLAMAGIRPDIIDLFIYFRNQIDPDEIMKNLARKKIELAFLGEKLYPPLLREIYDPPPVLYYKGSLDEKTFAIPLAVVGTRKASDYGKRVSEEIVRDLALAGLTIVSGLALGIDAIAHKAALKAKGQTVAFLGSGVDEIYPRTNHRLAQEIANNGGCLISEYPPETPALKANFPRRNRLIAGSCLGTLIIEAAEKSGALITGRSALEEGREVFAIPGSIYSLTSVGPNNLIKLGARTVTTADDIISMLGLPVLQRQATNVQTLSQSPEEEIILRALGDEAKHANELARETKLDINLINARLIIMEMKGLIKLQGSSTYIKLRRSNLHS